MTDCIPSARQESAHGSAYRCFHERRYRFLAEVVANSLPAKSARMLVVGPSFEVPLLRDRFPDAIVDTLGIFDPGFAPRPGETHVEFDLNSTVEQAQWPSLEAYDVVIAAEVIEHLYVPPAVVFPFLASCLVSSGRLVIQTPNAVALSKRIKMLVGRQPYMLLGPPPDPGHVREYTLSELGRAGAAAGLRVERQWARNYFGYSGVAGWAYNRVCDLLPRGLRNGITIVFVREISPRALRRSSRLR